MAFRYFARISFDGKEYAGWQIQPNAITVQQKTTEALSKILGTILTITGCGRTDSGVHASEFYFHFDFHEALTNDALKQLVFRVNRMLPHDIYMYWIRPVLPGAHARFSAISRSYSYQMLTRKDPFKMDRAWLLPFQPDIDQMNACARQIIGKHNFQSFSKVHTQVNNYFCNVSKADFVFYDHAMVFEISADRFLRNMVRALVGTLLEVGRNRISCGGFQEIMNSHNRSKAGISVPAKGLTLTKIEYPDMIFVNDPVYFSPDSSNEIISHYYTNSKFHNSTGNESDERSDG
jgi:tRNA pseudouridine38-40 synthase